MSNRHPITSLWDEDDDGNEHEVKFPTHWEICDTCHGEGHRTNPAIDGNGLSPDDPDLDEDFWDGYWSGRYDITCDDCEGTGKVLTVDESKCTPEMLAQLAEAYQNQAETDQIMRMERMMGA